MVVFEAAHLSGHDRHPIAGGAAMPELIDVGIEGVTLVPLTTHPDLRGSFTEDYRREWIPGSREMVQGNISISRANVLRGLHFHRRQADWWNFYTGAAVVGLYDLRSGSPTEGKGLAVRIDTAEGLKGLYIPAGVAHGFYAETDVMLHYMVDNYFTGDDEFGITWDDPDLGVDWPATDPILSDRDRSNLSLAEVLRDPPPYAPYEKR
jgi:dTDP-4-dehydrorhamnose 3,5-epimerase